MEVREADGLEAGGLDRGPQTARRVPPTMTEGHVVVAPGPLVGGNGEDEEPAGPHHPGQLLQREHVVVEVLDHVEARERGGVAVREGQGLRPGQHGAGALGEAAGGVGGGQLAEVRAHRRGELLAEHGQRGAGSAPDVEGEPRPVGAETVELRRHELPLGPEPPVVALDLRHHLVLLVVHRLARGLDLATPVAVALTAEHVTDADGVGERPQPVGHADPAALHVTPGDRHLGHLEAAGVGAGEDLDVEGEASGLQGLEDLASGHRGETLEAALRVEAGREPEAPQEGVVGPADHHPVARGADRDRALGVGAGGEHHVTGPGLEATEALADVGRPAEEIGVGEDHVVPPGTEHAGAHRAALADVPGQPEHLDVQAVVGRLALGDLGGAVVAAVVHEDELGLGVVQLRAGQRLEGPLDPPRLTEHRDHQCA